MAGDESPSDTPFAAFPARDGGVPVMSHGWIDGDGIRLVPRDI
jgi:hypothetical protein